VCSTKVFSIERLILYLDDNTCTALFPSPISCLVSPGMTNAGKTFTILGTDENPGILPRTLQAVFQQLSAGSSGVSSSSAASSRPSPAPQDFYVLVSYLEIYNEHCYDLLANVGSGSTSAAVSKKGVASAAAGGGASSSSSAAASSGTRVPLKLKDGK
jgi:hypothetical protein